MTEASGLSILMLAPLPPWPVNSGSKVRMFHLARSLSSRHRVTLFSLRTPPDARDDVQAHLPCVDVRAAEGPATGRRAGALLRGIRRREPVHVSEAWSAPAATALSQLARAFDVAHVFHLTMVQYLPFVRAGLRVYDPMGNETVYMERLSRTAPAAWRPFVRWNLKRVRAYEAHAVQAFDSVLSVSSVETPHFQRAARRGAAVATVPIAPDTSELLKMPPSEGTGQTVLFAGTLDWFPNIDAARFLASDVWPLVRARVTGARLSIAGKDPVDDVRALGKLPGVTVLANPDSMVPLLQDAAVVTAPIRTGSGIKIKTVEAMAAGKAVVATSLGCEGWDVVDRIHLRRADTAAALADAVVELLSDASARRRLGAAAQQLVRERYTVERMVERVEEIYRSGLATARTA
jgi:glycosyltransferase involved in cell wall biosynthesis